MNKSKQRLPEIGEYIRGHGTLVAVQDIVPPPPPVEREYVFEEITARVELRLGNEVLSDLCGTWDFYGKGTSVKTAIEEAQKYAAERKIGPKSDLEVVVVKVIEQIRKQPIKGEENFYDNSFWSFKRLDRYKFDLPGPVESIVWSSKEGPK